MFAAAAAPELAGAAVAAALDGGEEGSRAARLHSFFASVISGIFGQGEEEEEGEMATRSQNVAAAPQPPQNRGERKQRVSDLWGFGGCADSSSCRVPLSFLFGSCPKIGFFFYTSCLIFG